jgi:hypothetical protein
MGNVGHRTVHPTSIQFPQILTACDHVKLGAVADSLEWHRHDHRPRRLLDSFGQPQIRVPRARIMGADGKTSEGRAKRWVPSAPHAHRRCTHRQHLSGRHQYRVRRALERCLPGRSARIPVQDQPHDWLLGHHRAFQASQSPLTFRHARLTDMMWRPCGLRVG